MTMRPKTVGSAPCQEVVLRGDDIDLGRLPVQTCWPGEPAPLITWPLVVTKGPGGDKTDVFNLGIYRMQVTGKNTTLILLAAPRARTYYPHIGMTQHESCWILPRSSILPESKKK